MNELITKLSPMLFYEEEVFDSKDYIYELKFDGLRCLAYLFENKTVLINKRGKDISFTYPEILNLHENAKSPCILDGEIVVMKNNKPSFYVLQKRALLTNQFKIKLQVQKNPVTFIAYDIIYLDSELIIDLKLIERKRLLNENIKEDSKLVISRFIEEKGKDFFALAKREELEGIVAKEKKGKYFPGKRSRVWLKMKVYLEEDLVICGYTPSEYGMKDVIFGNYNENNELYKVATIMSNKDKNIIMNYAKNNPGKALFSDDNIVWMKPYLVGKVKYMMKTDNGNLRQAVFLGVRDDKVASDLIVDKKQHSVQQECFILVVLL